MGTITTEKAKEVMGYYKKGITMNEINEISKKVNIPPMVIKMAYKQKERLDNKNHK